jgi:hypothetical protein
MTTKIQQIGLALFTAGFSLAAGAATEADVEAAFNPYKNGFPSFPGLAAGTVVNLSLIHICRCRRHG